jgi:hypothetical protein
VPRLRQDAEIAFWCTCLKEKKLVLEPMMSTWPEAESVFKRMTKCGVRWCQSICGTQMCIGWEFKARTIRMIYLLVHCCLHDSNSLAMNSAAVLHRTNADLRYGGGAKGYTFPIWWSRWAWATELGVNWVWAGGLADSMRFSGEKQLRYEHIWIWTLKNSFRFLAASWLPCTFCAFLQ